MLGARSIAVVGASARPGSFGERVVTEVCRSPGEPVVHLVNPRWTEVQGRPCLPSLAEIHRCVAVRTDMRSVGMEDITPHYVTTLRDWRERFAAQEPELERRGYDERFRRMWQLYLAYCEGGFAERRIGVVQAVLAKPHWRGSVRAGITAPPPIASSIAAAG